MKKSILIISFIVFAITIFFEIFSIYLFGIDTLAIIPHVKEVAVIIHIISIAILIFCIHGKFKNHFRHLILFLQSSINVIIGNELIGILLGFVLILLLFCDGKISSNKKSIVLFLYLIYLLLPVFQFGIYRVIFSFLLIAFICSLLICTHAKMENTYGKMITLQRQKLNATLNNGTKEIELCKYNFSERDIQLLLEISNDPQIQYFYLSKKYYMSLSNVKKTMSKFYKEFGLEDKKDLVRFLSIVQLKTNVKMK